MKHSDYRPEILGMPWVPGNLILVGSRAWGGRLEYVLGNCIVEGTREEIPVALFVPGRTPQQILRMLLRMQVGDSVYENGGFSANDFKDYPLYIDDTELLTIAYLTGQIFRFVAEKKVRMVVVDWLQSIDGGIIDESTREGELDGILCILKALAKTLGIVIILTSQLSRHVIKSRNLPTVRDLLDVTEAKEYCDQVILIHPLDPFLRKALMIQQFKASDPFSKFEEHILNVSMDQDRHYFRRIDEL